MKKIKHAKKYARMFLGAAPEGKQADALGELATARAIFDASSDFRVVMQSPVFTDAERDGALKEVGRRFGLSEGTVRFLSFLAKQSAGDGIGAVLDRATAIYSEAAGLVKATVYTPVPVGADDVPRVREALSKITDKELDLAYVVDPSILGGFVIKVGSTMYDASIKGQLRLLRDELLKGVG